MYIHNIFIFLNHKSTKLAIKDFRNKEPNMTVEKEE